MSFFVDFAPHFVEMLFSTLLDTLPIVCIIFIFQWAVLRQAIVNIKRIIFGFAYVLIGLTLFLLGLEKALFPLGESMALQLTAPDFLFGEKSLIPLEVAWHHYYWVYIFAAAIGFSTTVAEPSLIAVALKAAQVSGGAISVNGLRFAVAFGVAFGISLGCYRIVSGDPIHYYIIAGYLLVMVQTFYAPSFIVPLAYDSGGVTTSTVTVPLVTALGLGLASTVPGRSPLIDGFGLIAFASLFPIISVLGYAHLTEFLLKRKSVNTK